MKTSLTQPARRTADFSPQQRPIMRGGVEAFRVLAHNNARDTIMLNGHSLDVQKDVNSERGGNQPRTRSEGPQEVPFSGGDGESRNDHAQLGAEHAEEELLTASVVTLCGYIALADLQFV